MSDWSRFQSQFRETDAERRKRLRDSYKRSQAAMTTARPEGAHMTIDADRLTDADIVNRLDAFIQSIDRQLYQDHVDLLADAIDEIERLRAVPAPGWRTMPKEQPGVYPFTGERMIVGWNDISSLPMHVELGRWRSGTGKGSGWCNTYGHSFGNAPTHFWPLPSPPQEMSNEPLRSDDAAPGSVDETPADAVDALTFGQALRLIDNLLCEHPWEREEALAFLAKHRFRRLCR
jgi:hypothetical protein